MTIGNGIVATYSYDDASQLQNIAFKNGVNPVTSNSYVYDLVGNRTKDTDLSGANDYTYDAIYRLKTATHPAGNPNEFFNYVDPVGSVGNRTSSHLSSSYITNELNRLTEDDSYFYGYDADGNLISKQNKSTNETTYFYFDAENKLVQVDKYNSTPTLISSVSYSYDGFGRRVKKNVNGTITYYVYDMEDIRFETDASGQIIAEYTHGSGIDEPLAMRRGGANYYYHVNGLGSVTALTNSSKTVVQSYVYDSFGQIISQAGSITNPYTFTAREYDSETGLYYYRARYYDARTGKFISEDPIGLAGGDVNLYAMVSNSPINLIDPWGLLELSTNGLKFIAKFEGFLGLPYNNVANNATIGFGHLLHYGPVTKADKSRYKKCISEEDALKLLKQDTKVAVDATNRLVKVSLTQNQFDAIVSFTYNVGQGNLSKSNLLTKLNKKEYDAIASELIKWNKAGGIVIPGLTYRRNAEAELFNMK